MSAVIYHLDEAKETDQTDELGRLVSALGRYTAAELLELLYVGEEPGFFELIRGIFGLSEDSRLVLQNFLTALPLQKISVSVDSKGRCILAPETSEDVSA